VPVSRPKALSVPVAVVALCMAGVMMALLKLLMAYLASRVISLTTRYRRYWRI
jgi:hypothetical protein